MKTIKLSIDCTISADYTPDRPAPFCQDHDNPHFSDTGDPAILDNICIELAGVDIYDYLSEDILDIIRDRIIEEAENE